MKFIQAVKSYNGKPEGWTLTGTIFNVGQAHKDGLTTITEMRAKQLIQAGMAIEYVEGDTVKQPNARDPVLVKRVAKEMLARDLRVNMDGEPLSPPQVKKRNAPGRQTKVDPPPQTKRTPKNDPNPPPPPRVGAGRRRASQTTESPSKESTPPGGQTGPAPGSASSSAAEKASPPSTGPKRGMRRGDAAHKKRESASSRSTIAGGQSPGQTASTDQTGPGGASTKASENSED